MTELEISDDSGFIGIVNYDRYNSFISQDWDFDMIKERIISEMNSHNILFWGTGMENNWRVKIIEESTDNEPFREERGIIEVTNEKLYLTNYETLTMAAQFEKTLLPEEHHEELGLDLDNGKYMVKFKQLVNPENYDFKTTNYDFEIQLMKITNLPEIYKNKLSGIYWSDY